MINASKLYIDCLPIQTSYLVLDSDLYADVDEIFRGVPKRVLDVNLYRDILRDLVRDKQYLGADFVVSSLHPLFVALPGFWTSLFDHIYYGKAPDGQ